MCILGFIILTLGECPRERHLIILIYIVLASLKVEISVPRYSSVYIASTIYRPSVLLYAYMYT